MRVIVLLVVMLCVVQGCSPKTPPLKSPCVGAEDSPCGPRSPINDGWLFS